MLKQLFALAGLTLSLASHAGVIADYSLDASQNVVTNSAKDLQWLQWDVTVGQSIDWFYNDAEAQHLRDDGWEIASNVQMAELFNDFGFGGLLWSSDENADQAVFTDYDSLELESDTELVFVELFGDTHAAGGGIFTELEDPIQTSKAWFGHDLDGDGNHNYASVSDDYQIYVDSPKKGFIRLSEGTDIDTFYSHPTGGLALVKASTIPEPSALLLLSLGLAGLSISRRSNKC